MEQMGIGDHDCVEGFHMHPTFVLILALLPLCDGLFGLGRLQSVAVEGTLQCDGVPASKVKVKLYDKEIFLDKKLDEGKTDQYGKFHLSGSKREFTSIDPKLNIYHKCGYSGVS
ncbi:Transthyretin protein 5, partial [Trichostrongylus colubriformis]